VNKKTGILLINLGTPDSPSVKDVRKYLKEFLNDARVIDLPWLKRKLLVNLIIAPLRAPKSAKEYVKLFNLFGGESPLLKYSILLKDKLQAKTPKNYTVELAMRYGNPSIDSVLEKMRKDNYDKIIIFPLYPHYAASSMGTVVEKTNKIINKWWNIPELVTMGQFYNNPDFIKAFANRAKKHIIANYDHVLFSYHGLPEHHINKSHLKGQSCVNCNCTKEYLSEEPLCYKNTCYETTRLLVKEMGLKEGKYSLSFQSRLGKDPWIQPYTDEVVANLGKKGNKNLLVLSPAFVSDCLETSIEISEEYLEIFEQNGGEKLQLVESLNDGEDWVNIVHDLVSKQ
jgi:protoporphyrin/coproporphyrin ferrochelatase